MQGSRFSSSTTLPDEVLTFVKTHPLMDETVPLLGHRPWVVKTMGRYINVLGSTFKKYVFARCLIPLLGHVGTS